MVSFPLCRKACRPPGLGSVERARPDRLGLGRTPTTSGKRVQKKYVSVCSFRQIGLCFCSLSVFPPSLAHSPLPLPSTSRAIPPHPRLPLQPSVSPLERRSRTQQRRMWKETEWTHRALKGALTRPSRGAVVPYHHPAPHPC